MYTIENGMTLTREFLMIMLSIPQQIVYLRDLSDTVDTYIAKEIYKQDFNERDFTEKDILSQCYSIVVDELNDYGINLISDTYLKDFYLTNFIYYFVKFIKELPTVISTDTVDNFDSIIENSPNILEDILDNYATDKDLKSVVSEFNYNDTFDQYCKAIVTSKTTDLPFTFDPDVTRQMSYLTKIRYLRELATKYTNLIISSLNLTVDNSIISKILKDYDTDKITSDNLPIYSKIDTKEVPEGLKAYNEKMMLKHHLNSVHHIEYYLDPNKNPRPVLTTEALIVLVAHHVEEDTTVDEFVTSVATMVAKAETILLPSQKQLIDEMTGVVASYLSTHEDK
jgi:hypothetical protein